jgi:hypothetical protein
MVHHHQQMKRHCQWCQSWHHLGNATSQQIMTQHGCQGGHVMLIANVYQSVQGSRHVAVVRLGREPGRMW